MFNVGDKVTVRFIGEIEKMELDTFGKKRNVRYHIGGIGENKYYWASCSEDMLTKEEEKCS